MRYGATTRVLVSVTAQPLRRADAHPARQCPGLPGVGSRRRQTVRSSPLSLPRETPCRDTHSRARTHSAAIQKNSSGVFTTRYGAPHASSSARLRTRCGRPTRTLPAGARVFQAWSTRIASQYDRRPSRSRARRRAKTRTHAHARTPLRSKKPPLASSPRATARPHASSSARLRTRCCEPTRTCEPEPVSSRQRIASQYDRRPSRSRARRRAETRTHVHARTPLRSKKTPLASSQRASARAGAPLVSVAAQPLRQTDATLRAGVRVFQAADSQPVRSSPFSLPRETPCQDTQSRARTHSAAIQKNSSGVFTTRYGTSSRAPRQRGCAAAAANRRHPASRSPCLPGMEYADSRPVRSSPLSLPRETLCQDTH